MAQLKDYLLNNDHETIAEEILKMANQKDSSRETKKEIEKLRAQLQNGLKAVLEGMKFPELEDEMNRIRERIADLEQSLLYVDKPTVTKEQIIAKLKKDAESITPEAMPRLVKEYVQKIYAHDDKVIITGGVNTIDCGGPQPILPKILFRYLASSQFH
jgi:predicted  nucleic acid-binding Zn-ribbon protein